MSHIFRRQSQQHTGNTHTHTHTQYLCISLTHMSQLCLLCWLPDRDPLLGQLHRQHENLFVNKLRTGFGPHAEEVFSLLPAWLKFSSKLLCFVPCMGFKSLVEFARLLRSYPQNNVIFVLLYGP